MDLNVPFDEKDAAKALGARWDPTRKKWYVPAGVDINKFARWHPELDAWNRAADGRGKPPRRAEQRSTRGKKPRRTKRSQSGTPDDGAAGNEAKVSYIAGKPITGKPCAPRKFQSPCVPLRPFTVGPGGASSFTGGRFVLG